MIKLPVLVMGLLPYGPSHNDPNALITAESYKAYPLTLSAPVCWGHWLDNDYVFKYEAQILRTSTGNIILHNLDPEMESNFIDLVRAGKLFFSPGAGDNPATVRRNSEFHRMVWGPLAGTRLEKKTVLDRSLDHISYTDTPAIKQVPVEAIL